MVPDLDGASDERERAGRFEAVRERWGCGVVDKARSDALQVTPARGVGQGGGRIASRSGALDSFQQLYGHRPAQPGERGIDD
ncbi:hypothetical protein ACSFBX_31280 [Variovorax sp. RB2P76]|uniref:hypothetical protein n=1 Tax=Variovorax sp. RB2P76 TaxID=3443736 RepID=UPI003F45034A